MRNGPADPTVRGNMPAPGPRGRGLVLSGRLLLSGVALTVGVLLGASLGMKQLTTSAIDSSALVDHADPSRLYFLGIRALSKNLHASGLLSPFHDTPYELGEEDIAKLLIREFSDEDVKEKVWEVHSSLVEYGTASHQDIEPIPAFSVSVVHERETLDRALTNHLVGTFMALPECGIVGDLDALWSGVEKKVGLADAREVIKDLPQCRPADMMAKPIVDGFKSAVAGRLAGVDSTHVFPRPTWGDGEYRSWLVAANGFVTRPNTFLILAITSTLAFVIATATTSGPWYGGVSLLAAGMTLLMGPTALEWFQQTQSLDQLILGRTLSPQDSVRDAWLALVFGFEAGALPLAAQRLAAAGLFILALSGCLLLGAGLQSKRKRASSARLLHQGLVPSDDRIESAA